MFSFAKNEDLRKRMYMEYNNRGYPKNMEVLDKMIAKRAELARARRVQLVGRLHHGRQDGRRARRRPPRSSIASSPRRARRPSANIAALLKRKQQDVPGATVVNAWERAYYAELVRKASYDFDSQSVRPYFAFDRVKQGLFDVTSRLFGVTYRPRRRTCRSGTQSVEAYEMLSGTAR